MADTSVSPTGDSGAAPAPFTRQATGLVRAVSPLTSLIINFTPGNPIQAVGAGLFFALSLFAGGNLYLAVLLVLPMMLSFSYAYGLLTAAMPRTGGDYTLVSRILSPVFGVIVAFFQAVAQFLSIAFFGIAFVMIGLSPAFGAWGVISHNQTFVNWSTTLATSHGWQFGLGTLMILITAGLMAGGWGWTSRALLVLASLTLLGLAVSVVVAVFTTHTGFVNDFNRVVRPFTHTANPYNGVLHQASSAGVNLHPALSFAKTIPLLGVMATFAIYTYFSTYVGGELRQGGSLGTAHRMARAGILNLTLVVIVIFIFFHTFNQSFLSAAYGGGMPASIPVPPFYFFLTGIILHSGFVGFLLGLTFALFWPLIGFVAFLQPVRTSFAFAFDGILPQGTLKLSRTHSPYVAVIATTVLSVATLAWAVFVASNFFEVIVFGTLMALVAMTILGVAALVFPYRRPEMYRSSVTTRRFLGVPVVSIAGLGAVLSGVILIIIYLHYAGLGLTHKGAFLAWAGGTLAAALLFFAAAWAFRRRQGVDLHHIYTEIPAE